MSSGVLQHGGGARLQNYPAGKNRSFCWRGPPWEAAANSNRVADKCMAEVYFLEHDLQNEAMNIQCVRSNIVAATQQILKIKE